MPLDAPVTMAVGSVPTMKRAEKAERIGEILDDLYPDPPIPLDHTDPYTLLVAVALSAQTTDKKVNQVTPALFARGRHAGGDGDARPRRSSVADPRASASRRPRRRTCGDGREPDRRRRRRGIGDWEFLESLAGVGHKTASVVMAQAFGVPAFPVDTHIHRLAARWGLSNGTTVERTEAT